MGMPVSDDSITIGITAFNAEETIAAALASALSQDVPVEQILVVDDVSSDGTLEIVERFQASHPQIDIIRHKTNAGVAAARNSIIRHTRGAFLAFFDDDDTSEPNRVAMQRERIMEYERIFAKGAAVICHTARKQIYPDGTVRVEPAMGSGSGIAPHGEEVLRYTLMGEPLRNGGYGSCATCSQMARTVTFLSLGGFDSRFRRCGDSDLALRHAKGGGHLVGLAAPLVTQTMTGTTDKNVDSLAAYTLKLLDKHRENFDNPARYRFARRWIALKFDWLANRRARFLKGLAALGLSYPVETTFRIRAAIPNLSGNWAFNRFLRSVPAHTKSPDES